MSYIGRGIDQIDNVSTLDNLSFSGSTATFNLTQNSVAFTPVSADALQIQIDGIIQAGNYTVSGSTVTFDFTPSGSSVCNGIKHFGVGVLTTPSDGSVTQAKLGAEAVNESKIQISNAGSNGNFLQKQSGNTGGLTWASASADADNYFASSGLSAKDLGSGLHIKTADSGATANSLTDELVIEGSGDSGLNILSGTSSSGAIYFGDSGDDDAGRIVYYHGDNSMRFITNASERMRIDSSGKQKYNTTSDFGGTWFHYRGTFNANRGLGINSTDGTSGVPMIYFGVQDSAQGDINAGGGSVTYNTSSDYRRKENVENFVNGIDKVKQLKVYTFNFIDDPDKTNKGGFFAHEVDGIVPEAVSGEKDEVQKYRENQDIPEGKSVGDNILDKDGNTIPEYQRIDHSKMIPVLTKALQEAITKIETLEAKVTALENK